MITETTKSDVPAVTARFGIFEVDFRTGELHRAGLRVRLQAQPFRVLVLLLQHAGEVVSREDLQRSVWGTTVVDFEHSLGTAINKVRYALGDSAESPRFVETLARRGYRFIAPVSFDYEGADGEAFATEREQPQEQSVRELSTMQTAAPTQPGRSAWRLLANAVVLAMAVAAAGYWLGASAGTAPPKPLHLSRLTFSGRVSPGDAFLENLPVTATDGARLYFSEMDGGRTRVAQALIADGDTSTMTLPDEIVAPLLCDISPDGSRLILRNHISADVEQNLWIVPTLGGAARQVPGLLAHDATWMPDGRRILYATGNTLGTANDDGSDQQVFARLPGRAFWLRWSPAGDRLRFTLLDQSTHAMALWEAEGNGTHIRQVLPGWSQAAAECCGSWTPDGRDYVFESSHSGRRNIWILRHGSTTPVPLTDGPLEFQAPIASRNGRQIFFVGGDDRAELLQYAGKDKGFIPYGDRINAAYRVVFSDDGRWIAWVGYAEGALWRSRSDGTARVQLTGRPTEIFMMKWSPDAKQLVLMGREPGKRWQIEVIDADGSNLHALLRENRNQADPDWSPDGRQIVFGRVPALMGEPAEAKALYVLTLATSHVAMIPGSQGLFSPRWSPDGRSIAALSLDMNRLMLYDISTKSWRVLAQHSAADPIWSRDGRSLFFHDYVQRDESIYRVSVSSGAVERIATLGDLHYADSVDYQFVGLTPEDVPLVSASMSTANIYSADLRR